jgi:hypothetical protein
MKKLLLIALVATAFVVLFPVSARIADPLFTRPFNPEWSHPILLVWPDHVEERWVDSIAEVSPRPKGATYTFYVPPERQAWVEDQVRKISDPDNPQRALVIRIKQLGPERQQIQLESWTDGFMGLIYEARPNEIIPLHTRIAGPIDSLRVLGVHLLLCGGIWFVVWLVRRYLLKRQSARVAAVLQIRP